MWVWRNSQLWYHTYSTGATRSHQMPNPGQSSTHNMYQFSVSQIEYPLGGSSKKGSHVYFLLIVVMLLLLWRQIYYCDIRTFISNNSTIWQNNSITQQTCNRKYTWLHFLLLPPHGYSTWVTENLLMDNKPRTCECQDLNGWMDPTNTKGDLTR